MDERGREPGAVARADVEAHATGAKRTPAHDERHQAQRKTFHPLIELTLIRLREFWREREAVFWVFVFPVLMAFALGIAFRNTGPEKIRIAVENNGQTINGLAPSEIVQRLSRSADLEPMLLAPDEAAKALRSGRVALVLSSGTSQNGTQTPASPPPPTPVYRFDPTRPESHQARLAVDDALERALGRGDVTTARDERVTETGARYIDFLIPGLIGMNLMGSGMWGLGFAVVTSRGRKLLKRFAATPMRRSHYLLSFMLSRILFLILEVGALVAFGWLVFGVTVRGSLLTLALVSLIGGLTFSGIGLLISARPTTIEGVSGLMNLVMLPMWLLSGTFFSSERFPQIFQPFIKALPLTALNSALRAVMNEGATLATVSTMIAVMLAWCLVSFIIALRIFKWQ